MGTIAELQAKPDRLYPLLWLSNEGGSLEDNYKVDNIRLTMFGRVISGEEGQDDDASEIEVLSDMQLILLDFLNYFHQNHGQEYVTDKAATLEHFTERTNDRTAGYSCVLELKQFYDWNKCQIPESGASIPPTVDGLTLYDFCDQSVIDRLTPTQTACLQSEFGGANATVNANGVLVDTVAPGGTLNINVHDTDDADVGSVVSTTEIEIADNTINFNGSDVDSVKAEEAYAFLVKLDGVNSGVYDAGTNTVSVTSPTCVELSVTLSDYDPDFGDTITITGTASGFTPDEYKFFVFDGTSATLLASQVSNTYDYLVNSLEADIEIYVMGVEDGVDIVGGGEFATVNNIPTITDSVHFNGTNNYATVAADNIFDFGTGEITQAIWLKADTVVGNDGIFETSYGSNGIMIRRVGESIQLYLNGGSITINGVGFFTGLAGTWVHMLWTRTAAGAVTLYRDGVSFGTGTDATSLTDNQSLKFGKYSTEYFEGNMLTPFFVDRLLTGAEITEVSGTPAADPSGFSFYADIIEYWNFGTGDTIPTLIGGKEGKNATTTNMTAGNIEADVP